MPPALLRVIGIACLLSNIGIGIWFASTDASMTRRVFMMGLLGVLVAVGLLCLATASQLTMRERRARAVAAGQTSSRDGSAQVPTSSEDGE